jgi:hypothetical protein
MRLFPARNHRSFDSGCIVRHHKFFYGLLVRHGQTPARHLHLPESECSGVPDAASSSAFDL